MNNRIWHRNRFTLIELLVVIAIISILASMLLPALRRARETARRASCLNSIKQVSMIAAQYRGDFGGWWPSYFHNPGNPALVSGCYWPYYFWFLGYLKRSDRNTTTNNFDLSIYCPTRNSLFADGKTDAYADYTLVAPTSVGGGGLGGMKTGDLGCRESQIAQPSKLIAYGEGPYWIVRPDAGETLWEDRRDWPSAISSNGSLALSPWTHQMGSNYCYADGHGDFIDSRQITLRTLTDHGPASYDNFRPDFTQYVQP